MKNKSNNKEWGKGYQQGKQDAFETPMGVSQWKNHGEKYKYFEFFEDKIVNQIKEYLDRQKKTEKYVIWGYKQCSEEIIQFLNKIK